MRGLLIKDLCLLKMQRNYYIGLFIMSAVFSIAFKNPSFNIFFLPYVMSNFTLSTISYDEFDNGRAFLFCLPINRKIYVFEKYLFGFITAVFSVVVSFLVSLAFFSFLEEGVNIGDLLILVSLFLSFILVSNAVLIPIQLKFGSDKLRTAIFVFFGSIALIGYLIYLILGQLNVDVTVINNIISSYLLLFVFLCLAFLVAFIFFSVFVSIKIIQNKEF